MKKFPQSFIRKEVYISIFPFVLAGILGMNLLFPVESVLAKEKEFDLQVFLTKEAALKLAFPGADAVKKQRKWPSGEQKKAIEKLSLVEINEKWFTFYEGQKDGKPMGYVLIDHIIGKSYPITFMTVINVDGTVRDVEILVYREPRGWEVRFPSFMSQFFGRNAQSDFREINTITGATLSVRAITTGVKKAVSSYQVLYLDAKK